MTAPLDHGAFFAESMLAAAVASIDAYNLPQPALATFIAGAGVPVMDACEGLLWTRVDTVYPTDGTGTPFAPTRLDFDLPAWAFPVEMGILWCHQNIDAQGNMTDPALEQQYAQRDGQYRFALLASLAERFPDLAKPWGEGFRVSPWGPIGPEGGYSGGLVIVTVIANQLAQLI